jgi:hypothetical protein
MQCASAHMHLSEHHDHDGSHHQHQVESHAHSLTNQHFDTLDSFDQADVSNVVELDNSCNAPSGYNKSFDVVALLPVLQLNAKPPTVSLKLVTALNHLQNTLNFSSFNPRAPPHSS